MVLFNIHIAVLQTIARYCLFHKPDGQPLQFAAGWRKYCTVLCLTSRKEALSILKNGYNALQILIITIIMTIVSLHYHYSKSWTFHDISVSGSDFQKFNAIMTESQLRRHWILAICKVSCPLNGFHLLIAQVFVMKGTGFHIMQMIVYMSHSFLEIIIYFFLISFFMSRSWMSLGRWSAGWMPASQARETGWSTCAAPQSLRTRTWFQCRWMERWAIKGR